VALVEDGKTGEDILAAFVAKYGETALMAPPKAGFNWAAYLLPGIAIVLVGVVLGWVLLRRARTPAPAAAASGGAAGMTTDEADRLKDELARLES
jgi:cytochrome c-type biogenesis protein CcmH/NrfF